MLEDNLQRPTIAADQPFVGALSFLPPFASCSWERGRLVRILIKWALPDGRASDTRFVRTLADIAAMTDRFSQATAEHRRQTQ